jgi:hypothetical protein
MLVGAKALRRAGILSVLLVMIVATPARADDTPVPVLERKATELYRAGNYREAYQVLRQVLARAPGPEVHRALAACLLKLNDDAGAAEHLRALIELTKKPDVRARAEERLREVEERLARMEARRKASEAENERPEVTIGSEPPGATVYLDDTATPAGRTPWKMPLAVGTHSVRLVLDGFAEEKHPFTVRRGERLALPIALRALPRTGTLEIRANLRDATILVGGKPGRRGETEVPAGRYRVRAERQGWAAQEKEVEVPSGGRGVAEMTLLEIRAPGEVHHLRKPAIAAAVGAGAAALAGAVLLGLSYREVGSAQGLADAMTRNDTASKYYYGSIAAFGLGGAAAVTSIVCFLYDGLPKVTVAPLPGGAAAALIIRY